MSKDCPGIPRLPYHEFSRNLHEKLIRHRVPISGVVEITNRCNLDCIHCYISSSAEPDDLELTAGEWGNVFQQLADRGTLWLLVTGGEPFLRPDLPEILENLKRKGILYTLFTNGTLIDDSAIAMLREWRPFSVEVTLYGASEETCEKVTGSGDAFTRSLRGIELLLSAGVRLEIKTVVLTLNRHDLDGIRRIADNLGVPFRFDTTINRAIRSGKSPENYRLDPEEIAAYDIADQERLNSWLEFLRQKPPTRRLDHYYHCGAGVSTFAITARGLLNVCGFSDEPGWDLRTGCFDECWDSVIPALRERKLDKTFECRECPLLILCGHCAPMAKLETGDPQRKVDYFCKSAKIKSKLFDSCSNEEPVCE